MNQSQKLVFVYLGQSLPSYAIASIKFALVHSKMSVVLISNLVNPPQFDGSLEHFFYSCDANLELVEADKKFRNGFWIKTTQRFFALEEFMRVQEVKKCFHAELDNAVFNISRISLELDDIGEGIFVPMDHQERAIGSLMYINSFDVFSHFCEFAKSHNYRVNDMDILASYLMNYPESAFPLPSSPALASGGTFRNLEDSRIDRLYEVGVFDAAAIGQWYFGIDPRNTRRKVTNQFKNEKYSADLSDFWLTWDESTSVMTLSSKTLKFAETKLYNLHIHSKIHKKLMKRDRFKTIISLTNKGKKVVIKRNDVGALLYLVEIIRFAFRRVTLQ
jgi:hypothetical protein